MGNFYETWEDKGLNSRKFLICSGARQNSQNSKIKFNKDACLFNNFLDSRQAQSKRCGVTVSGSDPGSGVAEMFPNGDAATAEYGAN